MLKKFVETYSSLLPKSIINVERMTIADAIYRAGYNLSEAAKILGFTRQTLYNKLRSYGIGLGYELDEIKKPEDKL
jgi:DNA-binding NtrC family response regulator